MHKLIINCVWSSPATNNLKLVSYVHNVPYAFPAPHFITVQTPWWSFAQTSRDSVVDENGQNNYTITIFLIRRHLCQLSSVSLTPPSSPTHINWPSVLNCPGLSLREFAHWPYCPTAVTPSNVSVGEGQTQGRRAVHVAHFNFYIWLIFCEMILWCQCGVVGGNYHMVPYC